MPLQQHHIDEFKRIYRADFRHELSDEAAWALANRLVAMTRLLLSAERGVSSKRRREDLPIKTDADEHLSVPRQVSD